MQARLIGIYWEGSLTKRQASKKKFKPGDLSLSVQDLGTGGTSQGKFLLKGRQPCLWESAFSDTTACPNNDRYP